MTAKDVLGFLATILAGPATAIFIDFLRESSSRKRARFLDKLARWIPEGETFRKSDGPINKEKYLEANPKDAKLFDLAVADRALISSLCGHGGWWEGPKRNRH